LRQICVVFRPSYFKMTTTATFVGLDSNNRASSRVLKPPGGGSSISFGDGEDYFPRKNSTASPAPAEESPKSGESSPKEKEAPKSCEEAPKPTESAKSEECPKPAAAAESPKPAAEEPAKESSPKQSNAASTPVAAQQPAPQRVRQPPGGFSSKLW